MTQEFINKHIANICHYLGHPALERTVENPTVTEFFHCMAWCMDVCGGPRRGVGFFVLDIQDWFEFNGWLHEHMGYLHNHENKLYANMRLLNFDGYEFTFVKKAP